MMKRERENLERLLKELSPYYRRNPEMVSNMQDRTLEVTYEREN